MLNAALLASGLIVAATADPSVAQSPADTPEQGVSPTPPAISEVIKKPVFERLPTAEDMAATIPPKAAARHQFGTVALQCVVTTEGLLTDCKVLDENPTGLGYGDAGLTLSRRYKMSRLDGAGVPVTGRIQKIKIRWVF